MNTRKNQITQYIVNLRINQEDECVIRENVY